MRVFFFILNFALPFRSKTPRVEALYSLRTGSVMLRDTILLFTLKHPNGDVLEGYRVQMYNEEGEESGFSFVTIIHRGDGVPFIFIDKDYESMRTFFCDEFDFNEVYKRAIEEA